MDRLLVEAEELIAAAEATGIRPALVGGLAVRAWVGAMGRRTNDVDLAVFETADVERLGRVLAGRGYHVLDDPTWRRAVRGEGPHRILVDWTGPEVVDPSTLERYRLSGAWVSRRLASRMVPVIAAPDLLVLKLLGSRDQDIADLALLVDSELEGCDPTAVARRGVEGGAGDRVRAAAAKLRFAIHAGEAVEAATRVLGQPLAVDTVRRLAAFLDRLASGEDE
jgi:hypothetical protein